MPATLNGFAQNQIDAARYGLQSQIYTFGPVSLPTGNTTIFSVQNWNKPASSIQLACILTSLATATQNAQVQISWTADSLQSDRAQGFTDGFPAGARALPVKVVAGSNLKLVVTNLTTAPVSGFQLNYGVTVKTLNYLERLLYGFQPTTQDLAAIATLKATQSDIGTQLANLLSGGWRPFSLESMIQSLFENRRISDPVDAVPFHMVIAAGATESPTKTINVPSGLVYVLRGISLETASAGMNLNIDRDDDPALVNQLNAPAFVQADDLPWPFFIPAQDHFGVYVNGVAGTTYPVRLDIEAYQESDLLLGHLNMDGKLTPKIQLGLQ